MMNELICPPPPSTPTPLCLTFQANLTPDRVDSYTSSPRYASCANFFKLQLSRNTPHKERRSVRRVFLCLLSLLSPCLLNDVAWRTLLPSGVFLDQWPHHSRLSTILLWQHKRWFALHSKGPHPNVIQRNFKNYNVKDKITFDRTQSRDTCLTIHSHIYLHVKIEFLKAY